MKHNETVELIKQRIQLKQQLKEVEASLDDLGVEDLEFGQRIEKLQKLIAYFEDQDEVGVLDGRGTEVNVSKSRFVGLLQKELEEAKQFLAAVEGGVA